MWKALRYLLLRDRDDGQALVILGLGIAGFVGMCALAIDVGRFLWARNQIQAAVDASVLAAAASMPNGTAEATTYADLYWDKNNDFLTSQGTNVQYTVTFPTGNKAVKIDASADIPTWFARIFGLNEWHVSANGTAASQVLDIALVLDVSGSMCFTSYPPVENTNSNILMSPGRASPNGGYEFPKLTQPITTGTGSSITIYLNDIGIFNSTNQSHNATNFGYSGSTGWNTSTRYWQRDFDGGGGGRAGIIRIDAELFQITAVNAAANTLTVTRARTNNDTGIPTVQGNHAVNAEVWANRMQNAHGRSDYCDAVSKFQANASQNGPHEPFDSAISNSKYFISLFNQSYDKIGLAKYSTTSTNLHNLSSSWSTLNGTLDGIFYPAGSTNIAHGLAVGRHILDGPGKRSNAVRVIVLLTDGIPNTYCTNGSAYTTSGASCSTGSSSTPTSCPASSTQGITDAINQAAAAAAADITVYTIGLGDGVLPCVLNDIAAAGAGANYLAPTPAQLDDAFAAIAAKTHIALTE